jgi:hypothetical protein
MRTFLASRAKAVQQDRTPKRGRDFQRLFSRLRFGVRRRSAAFRAKRNSLHNQHQQ